MVPPDADFHERLAALENRSPWPGWFRNTVSAAMGAVVALVSVVLYASDVKRDARDALDQGKDHKSRIRIIEQVVPRLEGKVDEILRRLPR